jgi:hypothetical protein
VVDVVVSAVCLVSPVRFVGGYSYSYAKQASPLLLLLLRVPIARRAGDTFAHTKFKKYKVGCSVKSSPS